MFVHVARLATPSYGVSLLSQLSVPSPHSSMSLQAVLLWQVEHTSYIPR